MIPTRGFIRLYCILIIISGILSGCAGAEPQPRGHEKIESYPTESLLQAGIDPLHPSERNSYVALSVSQGSSGLKDAKGKELDVIAIEDELLRLINLARSEDGSEMLKTEETILWAARIRSNELNSIFSHTRPNKTAYYTVFDEVGYSYSGKWHGENASTISFPTDALIEADIALLMFKDLSGSPGHLKNMLRNQYELVGIGVSANIVGNKTVVTSCQLFSSK